MRYASLAALGLAAGLSAQRSPLELPAVIGDHMVLQRESTAPIWGWATPGEWVTVEASWSEAKFECRVGSDGRFRADVSTPVAGGPHTLRVRSGESERVLRDVLIGEVWVCSGQSNMEMTVGDTGPSYRGVVNHEEEIATADWPQIRLFDVSNTFALEPQTDCEGTWTPCTPESVREFSAVGYFFGRHLHRDLGVPVGLIGANWGGTLAEAWTSRDTMQYFPEFAGSLREIERERADPEGVDRFEAQRRQAWWRALSMVDPAPGSATSTEDGSWSVMRLPGVWQDGGLADWDGVVWFRRVVEVPAAWAGRELLLELGPIDDMDTTWFGDTRVGGMELPGRWRTERVYRVPKEAVAAGRTTLTVRVVDTGGAGGFGGEPGDLFLRPAGEDEGRVPLAGEWRFRKGQNLSDLAPFPRVARAHRNSPTVLFQGMIAPIVPFGIRGAIWYQGESNRGRAYQYRYLFPALIADWRRHWDRGEFPFYFVQISPYRYGGDTGQTAELREAQALALTVPNTGMAVTMDVGDPRDIHPANKQTVGRRLALQALAKTYGREGMEYAGPTYRGHGIEARSIRLYFDHVGSGLVAEQGCRCFEIAGDDRVFHPARACIEDDTVVVESDAVAAPVAVRFAWSAAPEPDLKNREGLPAAPFRTDAWPGVTWPR